jgi:hypothetical protein
LQRCMATAAAGPDGLAARRALNPLSAQIQL